MRGSGVFAELLEERFRQTVTRLRLNRKLDPLDMPLFRIPPKAGDQMSLFS